MGGFIRQHVCFVDVDCLGPVAGSLDRPGLHHYLRLGRLPLTTDVAVSFATGLGVEIDSTNPRLAAEMRRPGIESSEFIKLAPGVEAGDAPADRLQIVPAEQRLDIEAAAKLLGVERAVVRAWMEPDDPRCSCTTQSGCRRAARPGS